MSVNTISDVTLELDEEVEPMAKGESSTPETREEIVSNSETEKQEVEGIALENESDGERQDGDASPDEDGRDKPKNGDMIPRARLNEEIFKKKKEREQAQRQAEENQKLRRELDELKQSQEDIAATSAPFPSESDPDVDYDPQKYQAKIAKWHRDEVSRQVAASVNQQKENALKKQVEEQSETFNARLRDYADKNPSYIDDMKEAGDPTWPRHIDDAVRGSDIGPQLDHYLLKNTAERERILAMGPAQALMEIGVIQRDLSEPQSKKKAQPKQTKAPAPIEETRGGPTGRMTDVLSGYDVE